MKLNYPNYNNTTTEGSIDITKIKNLVSEDDYKTISEIQKKYPQNTDITQSKNIAPQDREKIIDIITKCYNEKEATKTAEGIKQKIEAFFKKTTKIGETGGREAIRNNSDRKIALRAAEGNQTLINFAEDLTTFLSEQYKITPPIKVKIENFENIPGAFGCNYQNTIYINPAKRANRSNEEKISCFMNIYAHEFCHILDEKGGGSIDPTIVQLGSKYYISSGKYYQKNPIEKTAHLTGEIVSGKTGYGTPNDQGEGIGEERKQDLIQEILKKEQEEKNKEIEKQEKFNQYLKELNLKIGETLGDTNITKQDIEDLKNTIRQHYNTDGIPSGEIVFQGHSIHLDSLINNLNFSDKPIIDTFQKIQNQETSENQKEYSRNLLLNHIVAKILVETNGGKKEQRKENILNAIVMDERVVDENEQIFNILSDYILANYVTRDDVAYQISENRRKFKDIGTVTLNDNNTVYIGALQNETPENIKNTFSSLINQYKKNNQTEEEKEKLDTQLAELTILTENNYRTPKEVTQKNKNGANIITYEYDIKQRDRVIRIDNPNNEKQPTTDELDTQRKECYQGLQELGIPVKKIKLQHDNETYRIIMKQSTYNQLLNIKEDESQKSPSERETPKPTEGKISIPQTENTNNNTKGGKETITIDPQKPQPQPPQGETTTPTFQEENTTEQPKQPNIPQKDPIKKEEKIEEKSESKEQESSPEIAERLLLANFISKRRRESQNGNIKNQSIRLNDDYDINITESKVYYIPRNKQGETIERPFRFIEHIRDIINHSASNQEKDQRLMDYDIEMAERIILGLPKGVIEIKPEQGGEAEAQKIVDGYKNDPVAEIRDLKIINLPNGNIGVQKREKETNI